MWKALLSPHLDNSVLNPFLFSVRDRSANQEEISYPEGGLSDSDRENSGFWVVRRNEAIEKAAITERITELVEVGAGSGAVCSYLHQRGFGVLAIEPHLTGAQQIASSGIPAIAAFLHDVKFDPQSVPNYGLFDVLEHLPEPETILREIHRTLKPSGYLILTVPVGQWLWGAIDDTVGHQRRYSRRSLVHLLERSGFKIERCRYLFLALVPLAFVTRTLPYHFGKRQVDVDSIKVQLAPKPFISRIVSGVLRLESKVRVPYGLSLLVIATKTMDDEA
jgi:SAM-dependent methyltransferase